MSKTKSVKSSSSNEASDAQSIAGVRGHASKKSIKSVILMALYQFANDGKVSGRTGGNVMMRNGRSRAMTVPALVRNSYTSFVRSTFAGFSSGFRLLTPEQIIGWNNYKVYISNRFGVPTKISGKAAYVRLSCLLANIGHDAYADAPVGAINPLPTILGDASITSATFSQVFTLNPDGKDTLLYATACVNASISRPSQSAFRLIGKIDARSSSPANIYALYVAKFGAPIATTKIFIQSKAVAESSGLPSAISQSEAIVA